jgi:oligosaccharide repeat unit polymerase
MKYGYGEEIRKRKSKKRRKIAFNIILWLLLIVLYISVGFKRFSPLVVLSFTANGIFFYAMILHSLRKRSFSLDLMHAFFLFTFMYIAPFVQYIANDFPWGTSFTDVELLKTNLLVDLWVAVYLLVKYIPFVKKNQKEDIKREKSERQIPEINKTFLMVCAVSSFWLALILLALNSTTMFSRATNQSLTFSSTSLTLLATIGIRAYVTAGMVLTIYNLTKNRKAIDIVLFLMQTVALLIICCPTGIARYQMAMIYVGLLLVVFHFFKKGPWFILMMAFGLIIVFPFINAFRRISFGDVNLLDTIKGVFGSFGDAFLEGDYDAYTMFIITQRYVAEHGLTNGMQLLGVFLFFVPRDIWPSKPVGSGQTVAEYFNWSFTNLSSPPMAEGYINFGIFGIVIFAAVFSLVMRRLDNGYWQKRNGAIDFVYPFVLVFVFFIMRGDLLSSYAYTFGTAFVMLCIYAINAIAVKRSARALRETKISKFSKLIL